MQTLLFRVYLGKEIVQVKQFNKDQVVIGRNPDLDIILNHDAIAPIHALVEKRDSGIYLCDLGSEGGILYQGQKVLDVPLRHGDEFTVGQFTIQFYEGLPKPKSPPGGAVEVPSAPPAAPKSAPTPPPVVTNASIPSQSVTTPVSSPSPNYSSASPTYSSPSKGTFLPNASFKSTSEILSASSGVVVEVVVTWRERVINTYHFREPRVITAGYDPESVVRLPPINQAFKLIPILAIDSQISILLFPGMTGELFSAQKTSKNFEQLQREGRISQGNDGRSFFLAQKELVKIDIPGTELSLWVRYVPETPKAEFLPWLDFSPAEFSALVVSVVAALLMFIYTQTFVPAEEEPEEEVERIATFQIPKEKIAMAVDNPSPTPAPNVDTAEKPKQSVQAVDKPKTQDAKAGKAAEVAPKPKDNEKKPTLTSVKPIASKKPSTNVNPGGSAAPNPKPKPAPDVSKMGLFADAGVQKSLERSKDTGALTQVGSAAAAEAGERGNRPGAGLNVAATKAGPGGSGIAPIGIKGVGVDAPGGLGRSGSPGIGSGISKSNATIVPGGEGESIGAGMDKEAIRRVVREHINDLRTCYEAELNRDPNLAGKLVLQWEIKEGGRVGKVSAVNRGDTIKNKKVIKCCQNVLAEWRFPEPPAGMVGVVVYPFIFQSN